MNLVRQLTIEHLEKKLEDFKADFRGISDKLRQEQDISSIGNLNRQLESVGKNIDEIESELTTLREDCDYEARSQAISDLSQLLDRFADEREALERSYLMTLKKRYQTETSLPATSQNVIANLARYNAISEFVGCLVIYASNVDFINLLQDWGKAYDENWDLTLEQLRQAESERKQNMQPVVFFSVSRSDEATTQTDNEQVFYRFKAWLIADLDRYRTTGRGFVSLGEQGKSGNETYTMESLGDCLSDCLSEAQCQLVDKEPTVQVFLPKELLSESIDRTWQYCGQGGRARILGREFDVVVRCSNRLSRSYEYAPRWRRRWNQHPQLLEKLVADVFTSGDDNDLDELYDILTDEDAKSFVGLKVIQCPKPFKGYSLADVLLESGIPLAIWSRKECEDCCELLDAILKDCLISRLPANVRRSRRSGRNDDSHIGNYLTLLWDDPELLPPITA